MSDSGEGFWELGEKKKRDKREVDLFLYPSGVA